MKKMRGLVLFVCSLAVMSAYGQTKKIAFKSHSGSSDYFAIAIESELFDREDHNFGLPDFSNLDSVILVKDSVAVLVKKSSPGSKLYQRDTITGQPLLVKGMPKDSLKKNIKSIIWFHNDVETVKFVGFETGKIKKKRRSSLPLTGFSGNNNNPFTRQVIVIAGLIISLSLLAGFTAWKLQPLPASHPA